MRLLVVGGGGREHALVWKLAQSPLVNKIYCAPGNAGIAELAECIAISAEDLEGLLAFARAQKIDLTVVGPEAPLVAGIVDLFLAAGLTVFGPNREAAQLEGSKVFAKRMMHKYGIPTAGYRIFEYADEALDYLLKINFPVVIKADGLAAGKGVIIAKSYQEAVRAVKQMMVDQVFGAAGERIIIEECLEGEEVSVLALTDGENFSIMPGAQDHKAIFEGDQGPNTGGMGAYSPAPALTEKLQSQVEKEVFIPIFEGLRREGIIYRGVLYAGLMITESGPQVLEFNVRLGDPEAQVILPRMQSDLLPLLKAAASGSLQGVSSQWLTDHCACVVLASGGYPSKYEKGKVIKGLEKYGPENKLVVFHAGTAKTKEGIVTDGGRVLGVTSWDLSLPRALENIYQALKKISFEGCQYRKDIGYRALARIQPPKRL